MYRAHILLTTRHSIGTTGAMVSDDVAISVWLTELELEASKGW